MAHSTDIVGYVYRADLFCPDCIIHQLPTGPDEEFDGWGVPEEINLPTEVNLDEIAEAFGIDRYNEYSFDSDYFPKVVFRDQLESCGTPGCTKDSCGNTQCGNCEEQLGE